MPKHSNGYTIMFITVVALVSSFLLSTAATSLKQRQQTNIELDIKKNILKSFGVLPEKVDNEFIESFYSDNISSIVVNYQGNVIEALADDIDVEDEEKNKPNVEDRQYPVFIFEENNTPVAYTIPIVGKGLWSTLYGYLSMESDLATVRGITFYKHGETPGLGAEIEADWFQNNFKGKKILNENSEFESVKVVKGIASDYYQEPRLSHHVDGISGATITCVGVTKMVRKYLEIYQPYFDRIR